ncbi:hypothetical protein [Streptomyces sp. NPDC056512]|uniref:hypothetical protein n=1 Tax=Streptomyces sp. NPDC056512 TaxID=3345846 RepID=UPI0036AE3BB1
MTHHIDGPFPVTLAATKDGAALDVTKYLVRAVFLELFEDADADSNSFGEEFADMHSLAQAAQRGGADSQARHEFDVRMERMIERYADGGKVELYASGVGQLFSAVREIAAPRPVPGQRGAA